MAGLARKMCFIAMVASEEASGYRGSGDPREVQQMAIQEYERQRATGPASGRLISVRSNLGQRNPNQNFLGIANVQDGPQTHRLPGTYPIGTKVGATVKRAYGWDHGDQDGGAGKLGEITYVGTGEEAGKVSVVWDDADDPNGQPTDNLYRMGCWKVDPFDATKGAPGYDLQIVHGITSSHAERRAEAKRQRQQQQQNRSSDLTSASSQRGYQRHGNASSRPGNASSSQQQPQPQQQAGYDPNHSSFQFDSFRF